MNRTPIKRCSDRMRKDRADFSKDALQYLHDHPWCEIFLAEHGLLQSDVNENGWADIRTPEEREKNLCKARLVHVPSSIEVHHRNGRNCRERLLNQNFWMAVHRSSHNHIKDHQSWARRQGYLLPVNARPDGWCPGTQIVLTTPALLEERHRLFFGPLAIWEKERIRPLPFSFSV